MEEDTKELIGGIIVIGTVILVFAFLISSANKDREQQRIENIREINECIEKTADKDWCLNKFLK